MGVKTRQDLELKLRYSCRPINQLKYHSTIHMKNKILHFDIIIEGGQVIFHVVSRGVIGFNFFLGGGDDGS